MEMVKVTYLNLVSHDLVRHPREKATERKILKKKHGKGYPFSHRVIMVLVEKNPK